MKINSFRVTQVFLASMLITTIAWAQPNGIVPGQRIGKITVHEEGKKVTEALGETNDGDAAMGHYWEYWKKDGQETDVYSVRDGDGSHTYVRQIRITSPWFHTSSGIGSGSSLRSIRHSYPGTKWVAYYLSDNKARVDLYDNQARGITFEVLRNNDNRAAGRCIAVVVHPKRLGVLEEYAHRFDYLPVN